MSVPKCIITIDSCHWNRWISGIFVMYIHVPHVLGGGGGVLIVGISVVLYCSIGKTKHNKWSIKSTNQQMFWKRLINRNPGHSTIMWTNVRSKVHNNYWFLPLKSVNIWYLCYVYTCTSSYFKMWKLQLSLLKMFDN
jgi:hypothetical protein